MIYVDIYFKGKEEDFGEIEKVKIAYPNEKDFVSGMVNKVLTPLDDFKRVILNMGTYGPDGFLPGELRILGKNLAGNKELLIYPLPICMITGHLSDEKTG